MIAAARQRIRQLPQAVAKWSRWADRAGNRALERVHPPLARAEVWVRPYVAWARLRLRRAWAWTTKRVLRPAAVRLFRGLGWADRWTRRGCGAAVRATTAASAVVTPERAIGAVTVLAAAGLIVSQFIDYRAVEVGQPGYAGLPDVAQPPTRAEKTAGSAHAYLLIPLALLAAGLGVQAVRTRRRVLSLGVAAIGLISLAVILLVDMPAGLDAGSQSSRYAGAEGVLESGFYAELAAAAGLVVCGLLYYARPCRIPINLSGRAASGRRRRPRRPDSSRARVARSA